MDGELVVRIPGTPLWKGFPEDPLGTPFDPSKTTQPDDLFLCRKKGPKVVQCKYPLVNQHDMAGISPHFS